MQKIVKFTDDKYICPQKAICKFSLCQKTSNTVIPVMELQASERLL